MKYSTFNSSLIIKLLPYINNEELPHFQEFRSTPKFYDSSMFCIAYAISYAIYNY